MSRESESNYGGKDDVEDTMSHMDYDASYIEDLGDFYTNNDPHDMMERHQDFRYHYSVADYTSGNDMERYHDVNQPSSYGIDFDYSSVHDMERYHDSDYTSYNDNEVQTSSYASSYGTDFDYADDMVENVSDYHSSCMCDDIDYTFDNMQEEMNPITTVFKDGITYYGSSSRRSPDKSTMHSSRARLNRTW